MTRQRTLPRVTALARLVAPGVVATTAMTATTSIERRFRPGLDHPVDFDASAHVVRAVESVLRRPARTPQQRRVYFVLAHWGYGSAVALGYAAIRTRVEDEAVATGLFWAGCQVMAFTLFPTLGATPPPWRWRRDVVVSSLVQHAVYAVAVAGSSRVARR